MEGNAEEERVQPLSPSIYLHPAAAADVLVH